VCLTQETDQALVVLAQFGEHVLWGDEIGIVVGQALQARDVSDRTQRGPADLAYTLGEVVGHVENLFTLLVEQQVQVAETRTRHMPMEILGLQVKRERIGEQGVEFGRDVAGGVCAEAGGCMQIGFALGFGCFRVLHCCAPRRGP
jgi:hypothetical protein